MTNAEIIFRESMTLMKDGKISGSGEFVEIETDNGMKKVELPEEIHTYAKWKSLGYVVRKGEKSIARFPIWKYTVRKKSAEDDTEKTSMFMKVSSFFSFSQVEKIEVV